MSIRFCYLLFPVMLLFTSSSVYAVGNEDVKTAHSFVQESELAFFGLSGLGAITMEEFVQLKPKSIAEKTGQKMRFKDRMALKLTQKAVKRKLKKGESFSFEDASYDFSVGGFLLGFFFGFLGVLIALLLFPNNVFRSSLLGLLCFIIALLLGLFVF